MSEFESSIGILIDCHSLEEKKKYQKYHEQCKEENAKKLHEFSLKNAKTIKDEA